MATIAVLGTFDSKGAEHQFLADQIRLRGHEPLLIDVGTGGPPSIAPHCSRFDVASAAGLDLPPVLQRADRGECVSAMAAAAPIFVRRLLEDQRIAGIVTLGGSSGTAIGSAAMRALPIGFPKLIVSTMASGNVAHYVGTKDITIMPSIVDVAGLNRISRAIFIRAAGAICGMVEAAATEQQSSGRPLIVASMFGNTTKCVNAAIPLLEQAGYEVLVFHANGSGGRTMESLIDSGMVAGVLDIPTTELADELVGGVLTAGPDRVTAAARCGVPAIVTPGCLDMVNFGERTSVPTQFADRNFYIHNPQVTLMRTTPDECRQLGKMLAEKVNQSTAPVTMLIPRRAISVISAAGGAFHDAEADKALFEAIRETQRSDIPVCELDCEINDLEFAAACVDALLKNIRNGS